MSDNLSSPSAATLARMAHNTPDGWCVVCRAEPDWQCDEVVHKCEGFPTYGRASLPVCGYRTNTKVMKSKILDFFKLIETGYITLTSDTEPQFVFAGNVEYKASNGWRVIIFNDCNEWDYVDSVYNQNDQLLGVFKMGFPGHEAKDPEVLDLADFDYKPAKSLWWNRYGIPGWCKYKNPLWHGNTNRDPDIRVISTKSYPFTVKRVNREYWVTSLGCQNQENVRLLWKLEPRVLENIRWNARQVNAEDYLDALAPGFKEWRVEETRKMFSSTTDKSAD
ncbi:MAG: hypothetical protein UY48_C0009G0004 [Candidatus Gottesmanbacteria bacterium GW2011_GWB1_49_7]|uniref:Uncharacterized protein n=1 Tax=Candidatus Gottesmanbacteria bacterium GW2011_GWB1_49_7 TaxID=1618448 RepID=A0A0G1W205_9BACT|nr:MAG: hypothetical protein UY48_C0009G0004 [Candidatus Gottesmanbacteria bacterium GW2011_GWB1_49_7]